MIKKIIRRKAIASVGRNADRESVVSRVLVQRGLSDPTKLDYSLQKLLTPDMLLGLSQAVDLLVDTITQQKRLCVVGDFDADGATSTALCVKALRAMGLKHCDFIVPNRFEFGYGLTPEIVQLTLEKQADILLTVDNGISSIDGVAEARKHGLQVIITDHHLPGEELPQADAIVNPNQAYCEFASKNLAGVGVAFYLLSALRSKLDQQAWFEKENISKPNLADHLDLVALGTVADVVPLDDNNRILVAQGLKRIRAGKCSSGIQAMLFVAQKNIATVTSSDLGFALGPRLNAAGRLDDMSLGIQCLLAESVYEAEKLARELDDLNRERKAIESSMQAEALKELEKWKTEDLVNDKFGICLYEASWHEGVVGILASRIKERLHRPVIIFANSMNGQLKGSGRSIPGVHLRDVLDEIATKNPGLLIKFGGHAMAAGLSLEEDKLEKFILEFDLAVARSLGHTHPEAEIYSDGELLPEELSLDTAFALRNAGPWGQAFPEAVFDGEFIVLQKRALQNKHLKMSVSPGEYSGLLVDAIAFNYEALDELPESEFKAHLVYKLDINEYRGQTKVQLLVDQLEILE